VSKPWRPSSGCIAVWRVAIPGVAAGNDSGGFQNSGQGSSPRPGSREVAPIRG